MSAADSNVLSVCRGISTVGTGVLSGLMLSLPLWSFPGIFSVPTLAPRDRLHLWSSAYDRGAVTAVTVIPLTASSFFLSSYLAAPPPLWLGANLIARHRKAVLFIAGLSVLSNLAYTFFGILPTVHRLKKVEKEIIADPKGENGRVETDTLIEKWLKLHLVRVGLSTFAFSLSVLELITA